MGKLLKRGFRNPDGFWRGATGATLTDLMEQPEGTLLEMRDGEELVVPVHPYEIVSVRVNYDGSDAPAR